MGEVRVADNFLLTLLSADSNVQQVEGSTPVNKARAFSVNCVCELV